jgi:hypothetical protein
VVSQLPPNAGAFGSVAVINANLCLTWTTADARVGRRSHTLLPLTGDLVQDDRQTLNAAYYAEATGHANTYLSAVNALTSPDGALCVLGVVQRSRNGEPLPASLFSPVLAGGCSQRIGTIARRVQRPGHFPPL